MATLILDLSGNNPMPDFAELRRQGVRGVYLKATEGGTFNDPQFVEAWARANKADLAVGSYHFGRQDLHPAALTRAAALAAVPLGQGHMGISQRPQNGRQMTEQERTAVRTADLTAAALSGAEEEADHYIAIMRRLPGHANHAWRAGDLVPVLDFELGTPGHVYSPWRDAFQARVSDRTGHATMLYTYPGFNTWATPADEAQRRLWIADYDDNPNLTVKQVDNRVAGRRPTIPGGYSTHDLWQFTSKLAIPGAQGARLDASILPRGREDALDAITCHSDGK